MESKKTTYAFVDASNIIYRDTDENPWKIDLQKLLKYLKERFEASRVFYYGGVDNRNMIQLRLYKKMEAWGYELRMNTVKKFVNTRGEFYTKADVDSRMTFEMMEYLMEKKEKIWLLASPGKTAKELRRLFGYRFTSLDDTRKWLEYFEEK